MRGFLVNASMPLIADALHGLKAPPHPRRHPPLTRPLLDATPLSFSLVSGFPFLGILNSSLFLGASCLFRRFFVLPFPGRFQPFLPIASFLECFGDLGCESN